MDRGTWLTTVHGVAKVRHDLATKPPLSLLIEQGIDLRVNSEVKKA